MGWFGASKKSRKKQKRERREPQLVERNGKGKGLGKPPRLGRRRPLVFSLLSFGLTAGLWGLIVLAGATFYVFTSLDQKGLFKVPEREPGMILVAANGEPIAERGAFFGDEARIAEMPSYVPQAVIAIEDRRFRRHFGIDPIGLARATWANYKAGGIVQGGSTLTQQLAKNLFLKPERTFERKFQEAVLALWLESKYSKDEILQLYLNRVYFGAGAIGIEKAAQKFFNKSVNEVTLGEAAILAAVLKAPSRINPLKYPHRAEKRAREVIADMVEIGFVTKEEAERHRYAADSIRPTEYIPATQYIVDWVAEQLPELIGSFDESIVVETTLDQEIQANAEQIILQRLNRDGKKLNVSQGAAIVMDPGGAVLAMVGGKSYIKSQFNRAVKAKRQPGSAFKPFVYLAAIEQGYNPESIEIDEPTRIGDWTPKNYTGRYAGAVTLRTALAKSINTVAAKLSAQVGPEWVVSTAHRMGINSKLDNNVSIALGTSEVSLMELTAAYGPFTNNGKATLPHIVTRITNRKGKVLYQRRGTGLGQAISEYDAGAMNDMLRAVVTGGTGRRAAIPEHDIAGKTGTSQDYRDAWFIGYSGHLLAGIWVGNDDNSPTKRVTGGNLPAMIWHDIMAPAHQYLTPVRLPGEVYADDRYVYGDNPFDSDDRFVFSGERGRGLQGFVENLFGFGSRPQRSYGGDDEPRFERDDRALRSRENRQVQQRQPRPPGRSLENVR